MSERYDNVAKRVGKKVIRAIRRPIDIIDDEPHLHVGTGRRGVSPKAVLLTCVISYAAVFTYLSWLRYAGLNAFAYDLGIMESSMWNTLHGKGLLYNTVEGGSHLLVHLSPIMLLLLPIYAIYQHALTLLAIQSIAVALGAIPLYALVRRRVGETDALIFAILYLLYPPLWAILINGWHPVALAIPLLITAFYSFEVGRYKLYLVSVVFALFCKQTVAIPILLFAIYVLSSRSSAFSSLKAFREERGVQVILLGTIAGLAWFGLSLMMPRPATGWSAFHGYFGYLGDSFTEMVFNAVTHPQLIFDRLFAFDSLMYVVLFYLPLAFTPFLAPRTQLMSLPTMVVVILAGLLGIYAQYPSLFVPFIVIGCAYGVTQFDRTTRRKLLSVCFVTSLLSASLLITLPTNDTYFNRIQQVEGRTLHDEAALAVIDEIPDDDDLITIQQYYPYTFKRNGDTYLIDRHPATNTDYPNDVEYLLLDPRTAHSYPPNFNVSNFIEDRNMGLYRYVDGVALYKRGYDGPVISPIPEGTGSIQVEYFDGSEFNESVFAARSMSISQKWGPAPILPSGLADHFSVRWTGWLYVPETGNYNFSVKADDAGVLWVDGEYVAGDLDGVIVDDNATIHLEQGWHLIRVDYRELIGSANIEIRWKKPGQSSYSSIPNEYYSPRTDASARIEMADV